MRFETHYVQIGQSWSFSVNNYVKQLKCSLTFEALKYFYINQENKGLLSKVYFKSS